MRRLFLVEEELTDAVNFYKEYLGLNNLNIKIVLDDTIHLNNDLGAAFFFAEENYYRIRLSPFKPSNSQHPLLILAHEFIHVHQYASGLLVDDLERGLVWWKGKVYLDPSNEPDSYYFYCPWEQQAFKLQSRLFEAYNEHIHRRADGSDRQ